MLIQLDSKFTCVKLVAFIVICQSFVSFVYFCIVCRFLSYPLCLFRIVSICSSLVSYHLLYPCHKFVSFVKFYQEKFVFSYRSSVIRIGYELGAVEIMSYYISFVGAFVFFRIVSFLGAYRIVCDSFVSLVSS